MIEELCVVACLALWAKAGVYMDVRQSHFESQDAISGIMFGNYMTGNRHCQEIADPERQNHNQKFGLRVAFLVHFPRSRRSRCRLRPRIVVVTIQPWCNQWCNFHREIQHGERVQSVAHFLTSRRTSCDDRGDTVAIVFVLQQSIASLIITVHHHLTSSFSTRVGVEIQNLRGCSLATSSTVLVILAP